jgi:hypothetical protein
MIAMGEREGLEHERSQTGSRRGLAFISFREHAGAASPGVGTSSLTL